MLEHVWQTMRLATTTFVTHAMTTLTHRTLQEIGERHLAVLEALGSRDPDRSEAAMRRHIEEPGEWIANAIKQGETAAKGHTQKTQRTKAAR